MIKSKIPILIIVLFTCSSCMLLKENTPLPKKGYKIEVFRILPSGIGFTCNDDRKFLTSNELDLKIKQASEKYTPVVIIEADPNMKYKGLLKALEILQKHNIKDIYISRLDSIRIELINPKVEYNIDLPIIEIRHSMNITPIPDSEADNKLLRKFSPLYDSNIEIPIVKCPSDIQQYWVTRVIECLNIYSLNGFILQHKKQKYKIKNTLQEPCGEFEKLFPLPQPPEPPGEE